jgi:hypothetical protein
LGKPSLFLDAFPQVVEINVEVNETGDFPIGSSAHVRQRFLRNNDVAASLRCSNPRCQQGGLPLQSPVSLVIEARDTEREFSVHCNGHEGSPKGRRKGAPCSNYFKVKVKIKYKDGN